MPNNKHKKPFGDFNLGASLFIGTDRFDDAWMEDGFLFEESKGKQVAAPTSKGIIGSSFSQRKRFIFVIVLAIIFSLFWGRIALLQVVNAGEYQQVAENNRQRIVPIPAERGIIYDRNGVQLTKNVPKFALAIIPQDLPRDAQKREAVVKRLSEIVDMSESDIRATLLEYGSYSYESIVIQDNIDYESALLIQVAAADLPGIFVERGSKREYLLSTSSTASVESASIAHVLGYEGKLSRDELDELYEKGYYPFDTVGKTGVERTYEDILRGVYGKERIEVDARGRQQKTIAEDPPTPGQHIELSIDISIQEKLESILQDTLDKHDKHRGSAIAMDPRNGEILALVSLPAFDNNDFSGGIDSETYAEYVQDEHKPLFNRSIGGSYPSGSTVKPAIAAAALEEGIITPRTSFLSTGGIRVAQWFFPDWQAGGHGPTNVTKSIAWSVNTFYYIIGGGYEDRGGLGVDRITDYLGTFGFGSKLGIDIPGEEEGFLPSIQWKNNVKGEPWYIGDTYNLSIGQGDLLASPLQIAAMTAAIANGGTLYQPHVVRALLDPITQEKTYAESQTLNGQILSREHIETVALGMRECVVYGSCRRLATQPVLIAGKTGTAQWSSTREPHAWFTSFAPYGNPEIVVTVLIEEGIGGSETSVEVVDEFYQWWWAYRNGLVDA